MKGVVSCFTFEKVLKAFSIEPCFISTREAVGATCKVKLFMGMKKAWRYNVLFQRSQKSQADTHTKYAYYLSVTKVDCILISHFSKLRI